jgi:hypothetical protein
MQRGTGLSKIERYQNHDTMAAVAGAGVARDRAGGGWDSLLFIAVP